jgi:iron complex transport system ATP-binding protein
MSLLACQNLSLERQHRPLLVGFNWQLKAGECWALLGANGVGKSSLLLALSGLLRSHTGQIQLLGKSLTSYSRRQIAQQLALLPQEQSSAFPISLWDWALQARYPHQSFWGRDQAEDYAQVSQALEATDLWHLRHRKVQQLSGGERQRLAIASVLAQNTRLWLLDEPTNHLDLHYQMGLMQLLTERAKAQGCALLASLHDVNTAAEFCSHGVLLLGEGQWLAGPMDEVLTQATVERLYHHPVALTTLNNRPLFVPQRLPSG